MEEVNPFGNEDRASFEVDMDSPVGSPPRKIVRLEEFESKSVLGDSASSQSDDKDKGDHLCNPCSEMDKGEHLSDPCSEMDKGEDLCNPCSENDEGDHFSDRGDDTEMGKSVSHQDDSSSDEGGSQTMISEISAMSNDDNVLEEEETETDSSSSSNDEGGCDRHNPTIFKSIFVDEHGFPCAYRKYGCMQTFQNPLEVKEHVQGRCKYSVLFSCRDPECRGSSKAKFQSLDDLVIHTTEHHGVPNFTEEDGLCSFAVPPDFFKAPVQGDVNAKIIGQAETKDDGEENRVSFFLISSWRGIKDKHVYVVPVQHSSERKVMDYFVQIKCAVRGQGNENLVPITGLKEPPLNIAVCQAIGSPERFFHDMEILDVVSYDKDDFVDKGRVGSNGNLEYDLFVSLDYSRVRILRESGLEPRKYSLGIKQLKLDHLIQQDLLDSENYSEIPAHALVLIPQLYGDADLMIESDDQEGLFPSFSSALMSYAIKTRDRSHVGAQKCIGILIFPTPTLLKQAESSWKEKGAQFGVLVSSLPNDSEVIIQKLQLHGTEILLTTPSTIIKATHILTRDFISNLNFVVVFDADYFMVRSAIGKELQQCMDRIEDSAKKNLVRVAISPVVNQRLVTFLYSHGFTYSCNIFSVGIKPDASISKMERDLKYCNRITYKRQAVLKILAKHLHETNRWIIFAEEDLTHCPGHMKSLIHDLQLEYKDRVSSVLSEKEMEVNSNAFEPFLANPRGILVTGYFALASEKIKIWPYVLMHTLPSSKADLRRVADLVLENGDPNPCYGLKDPYIHDFAFEKDIFDQN